MGVSLGLCGSCAFAGCTAAEWEAELRMAGKKNKTGLDVRLAESKQNEVGRAGDPEPDSAHLPRPQNYQRDSIQTQYASSIIIIIIFSVLLKIHLCCLIFIQN